MVTSQNKPLWSEALRQINQKLAKGSLSRGTLARLAEIPYGHLRKILDGETEPKCILGMRLMALMDIDANAILRRFRPAGIYPIEDAGLSSETVAQLRSAGVTSVKLGSNLLLPE